MEKIKQRGLIVISIVITFAIVVLIVTVGMIAKNKKQNPDSWILQAYGNSVALYNDDKRQEIFTDIVLDTLPEDDIRQLENGIAFSTKDEALKAIEDYDG